MITKEEFKKQMAKAQTWADGEKVMNQLTKEQMEDLVSTFNKMREWDDITMRDEWVLGVCKSTLNHL